MLELEYVAKVLLYDPTYIASLESPPSKHSFIEVLEDYLFLNAYLESKVSLLFQDMITVADKIKRVPDNEEELSTFVPTNYINQHHLL